MSRTRADTVGVKKAGVIPRHNTSENLVEHYDEFRELGAGAFGRVSLVKDRETEQERVLKVVDTSTLQQAVLEQMRKEIELLRTLDHPSIVRLYEYAEDQQKKQINLVLEYIPGGDCEDLLKNANEPLEESLVGRLVYQLFVALAYCHLRGVVHRDIKPQNVMVLYPPDEGEPDCKIIDFGLASQGTPVMKDFVGSPQYMAPQLFRRSGYTAKADVWSAGVFAMEMFTGQVPFALPYENSIGGYSGFHTLEVALNVMPAWDDRSDEAKDFIRHLLQEDPNERLSAEQALEHPWLDFNMPPPRKFPERIARSLKDYCKAPPVVRCCLLSIAARTGTSDIQMIGHTFLGADGDGDGLISKEDLEEALEDMYGSVASCFSDSRVDVDMVLDMADLDHSGGLSFTEFVAACMFADYDNIQELANNAFTSLDSDRDGLVFVADIRGLFRERDKDFLDTLPQDAPFDVEEWCECVETYEHQIDPNALGHRQACSCIIG